MRTKDFFLNNFLRNCYLLIKKHPIFTSSFILLFLGGIDNLTGDRLSITVFYLIPIAIVTLNIGKKAGILAAVITAFIQVAFDNPDIIIRIHPFYHYWNILINMTTFILFAILSSSLKQKIETEKFYAGKDIVTGLPNGETFYKVINYESARCKNFGHCMSIIYIDFEYFENISNISYMVMPKIAHIIRGTLRETDLLARTGYSQFGIILTETDEATCNSILELLKAVVTEYIIGNNYPVKIDFSSVSFTKFAEDTKKACICYAL